jgi:hypothetical protein
LKGIVLDQTTQLSDRKKTTPRLSSVMATPQWFDWKQFTDSESGNPLTPDRVWDANIRSAAKEVALTSVSPVLIEIAVQCRRNGDWNRWQAALEFLLERDNESPAAEAAYWELMMHTGSIEVKRHLANQLQTLKERNADGLSNSATTLQQASPFARLQSESTSVQPAAFSESLRRVSISSDRDLPEFTRILSKWPDAFSPRRSEPRWGWLIASRYREMQQRNESANATVNLGRSYAEYWPTLSPYLPDWKPIAKAERQIYNASMAPPQPSLPQLSPASVALPANGIPALSWTTVRPYLDGKADEAFWQSTTQIELRDPWATEANRKTTIKFARDHEYLYLFSFAPGPPTTQVSKEKQRDSIKPESDQIRLRIDLDRDYASWFEIGWSATGESCDALNDMPRWNPTWYRETSNDGKSWSTEIAIPLDQLVVSGDAVRKNWTNEVWAFSAIRAIPGVATHSLGPSIADRATADDWFLLDLNKARHSTPK